MIYYSKEARQSALTRLQELRERLSRIPGNVVDTTTIADTIHYPSALTDAIESEEYRIEREATKNRRREKLMRETVVGQAELSFDISESGISTDELQFYVHAIYGTNWKFNRTESRYDSCVVAIFEEV